MSRIGKKPVVIPNNVKAEIKGNVVSFEGPKGRLEHKFPDILKVVKKGDLLIVENTSALKDTKEVAALHGTTRSILANLIKGVLEGYKKELEVRGVGFKAEAQGQTLRILLGFSHPINYKIPEGITITTAKPTEITIIGIDKVKVGEAAAEIREYFKPEPYTGKGIRYVGEYVRHKAGKTVVK